MLTVATLRSACGPRQGDPDVVRRLACTGSCPGSAPGSRRWPPPPRRPCSGVRRSRSQSQPCRWRLRASRTPTPSRRSPTPASDLVANGRVAKFLIDDETRRARGCTSSTATSPRAARLPTPRAIHYFFAREALGIPESLGGVQRLTYFTQDKRYVAGVVHTYLLDGPREPVYGLQFYPQDVIAEEPVVAAVSEVQAADHHPRGRARLRADRSQQTTATVTDELAAAGIEVLPARPDPRLDPRTCRSTPARPGATCGSSRADNDELRPDRHPGLRRAAARSLRRRRRAHPGGAGHQLARQPEVEGAQHPERGAARRRPGQPAAGAVRRPAGASRRRAATTS